MLGRPISLVESVCYPAGDTVATGVTSPLASGLQGVKTQLTGVSQGASATYQYRCLGPFSSSVNLAFLFVVATPVTPSGSLISPTTVRTGNFVSIELLERGTTMLTSRVLVVLRLRPPFGLLVCIRLRSSLISATMDDCCTRVTVLQVLFFVLPSSLIVYSLAP
ncbi:hypothetical protein NMY22_g4887 [Coprinellus aureogranulatus]|nr:hypothetical protein NMY22_g4887 [Coprinellus aureogranulatus]